jgi:hypothetical protein
MFDPNHNIVCQNEAILDTHVAPEIARNTTEADSCFVPRKVYFSFLECRNKGYCEAATETANGKLGTIAHINNRPPGIHISALI